MHPTNFGHHTPERSNLPGEASHGGRGEGRDGSVPLFLVSSLVAGLPFLGLLMIVTILTGEREAGPVERLVTLLAMMLTEGLAFAFFWRRMDPSTLKNFAVATYSVGIWAFMGGCLVTTFGLRFGGAGELARNTAFLGSGIIAVSGFSFALVWAQSQNSRAMIQTHTMVSASVVLAGFIGLILRGTHRNDHQGQDQVVSAAAVQGTHAPSVHDQKTVDHDGAEMATQDKASSHHGEASPSRGHGEAHHDESSTIHQEPEPHEATSAWSYQGATGPEQWGQLDPDWTLCKAGREQSPIDIKKGSKDSRRVISLSYGDSPAQLHRKGALITLEVGSGHRALISGKPYELRHIDWHTPSEHRLGGVTYPLELQFVHENSSGQTAVISALVEAGPAHAELAKVLSALPVEAGHPQTLLEPIKLDRVLPRDLTASAYQYWGSLTHPPCSEKVLWNVLASPIRMSQGQIQAFRNSDQGSQRPLQKLGTRVIGPSIPTTAH